MSGQYHEIGHNHFLARLSLSPFSNVLYFYSIRLESLSASLNKHMCMHKNVYSVRLVSSHIWATIDGVLDNGFIGNSQGVTTNNYNTVADFHTLQITTTHAKYFPACSVFTRCFLVTTSNNGYSSASVLKTSLNGGSIPTEPRFRVRVTLRLAVCRQSVRLGD
jgi:hypothetical protein